VSTRTLYTRVDTALFRATHKYATRPRASRVGHSSPLSVWSGVRQGTSAHLQAGISILTSRPTAHLLVFCCRGNIDWRNWSNEAKIPHDDNAT